MYYVVKCPPLTNDKGELLIEIHNYDDVGDVWEWGSGDVFDQDEIQSIPIPIEIDVEVFRDYSGQPPEMRDNGVCVMTRRLSEALTQAGVDNIDYYPAVLTNTTSGEKYNYVAYNIIGKVAAADLENSDFSSYDNKLVADVGFKELVLDESKIHGLLLFRLAEKLSTILIHDNVRKAILEQGIDTLTFIKPEDYVHL
jgi:hypothetical protein